MGKFVLTDASLVVNAVDLSDHVQSVTLNYGADSGEVTSMGDGTHLFIGGLKEWSMDVTFVQDFASGEVDATLFSIMGSPVTLVLKPTSGAVSASNPSFTGSALLTSYTPIGNNVGDVATAPVSFVAAGTLARAT